MSRLAVTGELERFRVGVEHAAEAIEFGDANGAHGLLLALLDGGPPLNGEEARVFCPYGCDLETRELRCAA